MDIISLRKINKNSLRLTLAVAFIICLLLLGSFSSALVFSNPQTLSSNAQLTINLDCEQKEGLINHYGEINCGPLPNHDVEQATLLTSQYQQTGIRFVRTHDFNGPTDVNTIFSNMSKDPTIASNYNFTLSDHYISSIIDANCAVFYRLGESASIEERLRNPPENKSKWAEICKHIIMHYNDGWADGYHYNITYFEIWNEPDLDGFWNGTTKSYFDLYKIAAETLKQYNPHLKIGGPCTSSIFNTNFTTRFLSFIKENQLPLDFYSWHMYADTPYQLYNGSKLVRNLLDSYGFTETESINTEWNYNILSPQRDKDNAKNAAFTACSLSAFQDAGIDYAFRYRGTGDNNWLTRFIGFDLSLFSTDGLFKTPALSFLAFHYLSTDTPIRLQTPVIDAKEKTTYLAGISEDNTNITLLLSNFDTEDASYEINIKNLPWNSNYTIAHYLIDENHHLQKVKTTTSDKESLVIENTLKESTIQFIRLTNTSTLPEEGPKPAEIPLILRMPIFDPLAKILGFLLMIIFFS